MKAGLSWFLVALAIVTEIGGTTAAKLAEGFTRPVPSILVLILYLSSIISLTLALKTLDVSLVYAIWSGVGTAAATLIGILYFKEPSTTLKLISVTLIVAGVVGLNIASKGQ